ncbi:MAG TPA: GNAT family N-acetyltransferase [Ohtaekwangia sp.]|nr:GNAT family N-acetyltransferase [Ohtaekwangia sp.]
MKSSNSRKGDQAQESDFFKHQRPIEASERVQPDVSIPDTENGKRKTTADAAPTVYNIDEKSADDAFASIVLAFVGDPAARWSWPHAGDYLVNMPKLARAFAMKSFGLGTAFGIGQLAGVALWLPPEATSDEEALATLMKRTVHESIQQDAAGVFSQMASFRPSEPHWYLPLIGVDPLYQGQGFGDKLMRSSLARCDGDRLPAYLESSNPRNIPLYQRHGFEVLGKIQLGSSPTIVPMLRRPRQRQ